MPKSNLAGCRSAKRIVLPVLVCFVLAQSSPAHGQPSKGAAFALPSGPLGLGATTPCSTAYLAMTTCITDGSDPNRMPTGMTITEYDTGNVKHESVIAEASGQHLTARVGDTIDVPFAGADLDPNCPQMMYVQASLTINPADPPGRTLTTPTYTWPTNVPGTLTYNSADPQVGPDGDKDTVYGDFIFTIQSNDPRTDGNGPLYTDYQWLNIQLNMSGICSNGGSQIAGQVNINHKFPDDFQRVVENVIIVNNNSDYSVTPNCSPSSTPCSLRQAIGAAANGQRVIFELPSGAQIAITNGVLSINKDLTISGTNVFPIINSGTFLITTPASSLIPWVYMDHIYLLGGASVAFQVINGTRLILNTTVINNDSVRSGCGSGISVSASSLYVSNSQITSNSASQGGAICISGNSAVSIDHSTIDDNNATTDSGGGIYINSGAQSTLSITNSTLYGNTSHILGGAIYNASTQSTITVESTTFSNNRAPNDTTIVNPSGSVFADATIFDAPSNFSACAGTVTGNDDLNHNAQYCPGAAGDPKLGSLNNNGGIGPTLALLQGSAAINGIPPNSNPYNPLCPLPAGSQQSTVPVDDERGKPRNGDDKGCDIGAFEADDPLSATFGIYQPTTSSPIISPSSGLGTYDLFTSNTGSSYYTVAYGTVGASPVVGDWNGDTIDTVGAFYSGTQQFQLRNTNNAGNPDYTFVFDPYYSTDSVLPVAGKWAGADSHDGVAIYVNGPNGGPHTNMLALRNSLSPGTQDYFMQLGIAGDIAVSGDWNGDGVDKVGVFRPSNATFYLFNTRPDSCPWPSDCVLTYADYYIPFGNANDEPLVGDWTGIGHAGIGVFRPSNGIIYLKNALTTGYADIANTTGIPGSVPVVAGNWGAQPPPVAPPRPVVSPVPPNILGPSTPVPKPGQPPGGLGD